METQDELATEGVEVMATQIEEGEPSKKTKTPQRKKLHKGERTASQFKKELHLEVIHVVDDPKPDGMNKGKD